MDDIHLHMEYLKKQVGMLYHILKHKLKVKGFGSNEARTASFFKWLQNEPVNVISCKERFKI